MKHFTPLRRLRISTVRSQATEVSHTLDSAWWAFACNDLTVCCSPTKLKISISQSRGRSIKNIEIEDLISYLSQEIRLDSSISKRGSHLQSMNLLIPIEEPLRTLFHSLNQTKVEIGILDFFFNFDFERFLNLSHSNKRVSLFSSSSSSSPIARYHARWYMWIA